jgi:hypothetical protein
MSVPLRAVADDGYLLGLDERQVSIVIVKSLCHGFLGSSFAWLSLGFFQVGRSIQTRDSVSSPHHRAEEQPRVPIDGLRAGFRLGRRGDLRLG